MCIRDRAQTIQNSKMLFIVACGNGGIAGKGYDTDIYPVYPASFPFDNVISVANLLFDGSLSRDSNYGAASVEDVYKRQVQDSRKYIPADLIRPKPVLT